MVDVGFMRHGYRRDYIARLDALIRTPGVCCVRAPAGLKLFVGGEVVMMADGARLTDSQLAHLERVAALEAQRIERGRGRSEVQSPGPVNRPVPLTRTNSEESHPYGRA